MSENVKRYIKSLEIQKSKLTAEVASKKRSLELVEQKLSNPEFYLEREQKRGAIKVKRALGQEVHAKTKTVLKKAPEANQGLEIPTMEMDIAPAPAAEQKKKSSWLNPFDS